MPQHISEALDRELLCGTEVLKPGVVRISMSYEWRDEDVDYVLDAIEAISELGPDLMHDYDFVVETGAYIHREKWTPSHITRLADFDARSVGAQYLPVRI